MKILKIQAFSKINLGLEVLYKRSDGFHEINTLFYKTCFADNIILSENPKIEFICNPEQTSSPDDNIAFKAAMLFKEAYKFTSLPIKIYLEKKVPAGAGLGGGSSDAASILTGLSEFFDIQPDFKLLNELALELGSDVPFFIGNSKTAIACGRGEKLEYYDFDLPWYILIINPGIHVPTKSAYQSLNRSSEMVSGSNFKEIIQESIEKTKILRTKIRNDFESPGFQQFPEIAGIKQKLYSTGALFSLMSGSGSSVFGLFVDERTAKKSQERFVDYFTFLCPP